MHLTERRLAGSIGGIPACRHQARRLGRIGTVRFAAKRRQSNFATHGRWPEGYPSTGLRPAPVDEYEQPLSRGDDEARRRSPTPSVGHNLQYCKPMERQEKTGFVLQKKQINSMIEYLDNPT